MSIWGKIIGGAAGFAIGGPLGAILGVMAGGALEKKLKFKHTNFNNIKIDHNQKQQIFALSIIVLSAKLAKSDGVVTKDEILAFKEKFNIPSNEMKNVAKIFDEAKKSKFGYEKIACKFELFIEDNKLLI